MLNIIRPYAHIKWINGGPPELDAGENALRHIEWAGRVSHRSEESQTMDSWKKFVETVVMGHGDWSIVEHINVTVDSVTDRGITHEWVRHRLNSLTQESTRFVNYEKKMPPSFVYPDPDNWEGYIDDPEWCELITHSERVYQSKLKQGWPPQKARSVFPNALASRVITTGNIRNWRHVMIMRTTKEAHPQMRQVTIPLLAEFKAKIPILFDDIEPGMKQSESMKRMR